MQNILIDKFEIREPIMKEELGKLFKISNNNSLKQYISFLLKIGVIKSFQKGIYYIPEKEERFAKLEPSIRDVIEKKYCKNYSGFRTGAHLINQYGLTTQVSSTYEIVTSKVSSNTRNKKVLNDRVIVTSSKQDINENNYYYMIYAEIIRNIKFSDYNELDNIARLQKIYNELNLEKELLLEILSLYKGNKFLYIHRIFEEVLNYEIT